MSSLLSLSIYLLNADDTEEPQTHSTPKLHLQSLKDKTHEEKVSYQVLPSHAWSLFEMDNMVLKKNNNNN